MKPPSASRFLVALLAGALLVAAGAGCGKKDKVVGPGSNPLPSPLPDRSTPQNALSLYAYAWVHRDSTILDSLIDATYVGTSIDLSDPTPFTRSFTKSDEIHDLGGLEKATDVTRVEVNLGPASSWVRTKYAGDPPDWVALQVPAATIRVYTTVDTYVASGMDVEEWKFAPHTPAPTSPTDTVWTMIRWSESKPALP
ncbi:MAG: hypothetical protein ACM3JJ_02520 [Hyphomicrobiales bacterium]